MIKHNQLFTPGYWVENEATKQPTMALKRLHFHTYDMTETLLISP